jgi:hypothetical protein
MHELGVWDNFYVITGSSAAALTGLMFVVITLVAGQERLRAGGRDGVETFSSPTVVHFCAALLISGILSAPWNSLLGPNVMLALTGAYGLIYAGRVTVRMGRVSVYSPEFDDWLWFAITPLLGYAALFVAALLLVAFTKQALFAIAASTMLLIFVGIRNAWDTVTYIAFFDPVARRQGSEDGGDSVRRVDADSEDRNLVR